ncbi:MAG: trehalose-phosphatase [candidate division Zixibacteria bacterium]|nr:trehalose-phosphatase [candidate division Zixibacteria bacterium]
MKNLWKARREVLERVWAAPQVLLLPDYDGTLVPIRPTPELARLSSERKKILAGLALKPAFDVGILTGRSLKDIQKAVKIPGLFYAANYGLVIATAKEKWVHPGAQKRASILKRMLPSLRRILSGYPGVRVEDKALTVAVHYRRYREAVEPLRQKMMRFLKVYGGRFRLAPGKKIFEVYPAVAWDKGKALSKIQALLGFRKRPLVIFFGDDRADEEAFRQMRHQDISVAVGRSKKTAARYFCRNSDEVIRFLKLLCGAGAGSESST